MTCLNFDQIIFFLDASLQYFPYKKNFLEIIFLSVTWKLKCKHNNGKKQPKTSTG